MSKVDGIINSLEPFVHGLGKAVLRELREALAQPAGEAEPVKLAETCDGLEQEAWEAWGSDQKLIMTTHPLHYLFTDHTTYMARQAWKAGLTYASDVAGKVTTPQQSQPLTDEQARKIIEDNDWYNFPEEVIRATEAAHGIKKGGTE